MEFCIILNPFYHELTTLPFQMRNESAGVSPPSTCLTLIRHLQLETNIENPTSVIRGIVHKDSEYRQSRWMQGINKNPTLATSTPQNPSPMYLREARTVQGSGKKRRINTQSVGLLEGKFLRQKRRTFLGHPHIFPPGTCTILSVPTGSTNESSRVVFSISLLYLISDQNMVPRRSVGSCRSTNEDEVMLDKASIWSFWDTQLKNYPWRGWWWYTTSNYYLNDHSTVSTRGCNRYYWEIELRKQSIFNVDAVEYQ
ncbi:hypothetical protein DFJ58DRAFT_910891 [Suillus subalutaceus]|uniref:uncharacterized protein n=1 Tax=Suillus subalutaceus TaxID=48586 RepID=UPI001B874201|nr:uncharacterized protein DFJ58DRAFT_910891 [Suillus subalutaceus]KAG1871269.1 hypothetical protein DFJ58DRAFT_910891 [Suillus subalutaceus]